MRQIGHPKTLGNQITPAVRKAMVKVEVSMEPVRIIIFALVLLTFAARASDPQAAVSGQGMAAEFSSQTQRGERLFADKCASCHAVDRSKDPPLGMIGEAFARRWRSANDLYVRILNTMPKDKVLSLSARETADVTSYLLSLNGIRRKQELTPVRERLAAVLLVPHAGGIPVRRAVDTAAGYYSIAQARRGEAFFQSSCSLCHVAEAKVNKPGEVMDQTLANVSITASGGVRLGPLHAISHLAGPLFMQNWPSVGALYNRIRHTMPGYSPDGLDPETYLDITAYLLRMNGFPAGVSDLPLDIHQLKAMPLPEPGFTTLFNGRDFSGFGFVVGNDCSPQPSGCASTVPGSTFAIKDRVVMCSGHPYGYMYTDRKYLNFILRFEYRFPPWPGMEADDVFWGNSGYFVFIASHEIWPKSIEIEGMETLILRPLGIATAPKYTYDADAVKRARRPIGEWNTVEIAAKDGQIRSSLNGVLVSVVTQHEFTQPGYIAFQAEGVPIEWRNIRISEK